MTDANGALMEASSEQKRAVKSLGSLEAQLMDVLWDADEELSGQAVVDRLGQDHNYKTVMTVLNRLVEKDLLGRRLDGRAYRYSARQGRDAFLRSAADKLVSEYVDAFGGRAAEHLALAIDAFSPRSQRIPVEEIIDDPEDQLRVSLKAAVLGAVGLQALIFILTRRRSG